LGTAHYAVFDRWVGYCTNWAITDTLCGKLIGPVMRDHGPPLPRLLRWTKSRGRWRRRGAAVCLIPSVRRGLHHDAAFEVADRLMLDEDDMVRKGVGWLLKVTADADRHRVIAYLLQWKDRTARLVLRYACEKMTPAQRRRVLG
jgi:3-methyladenine DNA glycosylase AlkD